MKKISQPIKIILLGILIAGGIRHASAQTIWSGPACPPPDCNVDAPLNIGTSTQYKLGNLILNGLSVANASIFSGAVQINSGDPQPGDVLTAEDASGTAGWENPNAVQEGQGSVYTFVPTRHGFYFTLMQDPDFRAWFQTFPNGSTAIESSTSMSSYHNDKGFLTHGGNDTAAKLCEYFTGADELVSYKDGGLGSGNNNEWIFWDPGSSSWKVNTSTWNDSTDITSLTCIAPNGIIRGGAYVEDASGLYTGSGTAVRTTN